MEIILKKTRGLVKYCSVFWCYQYINGMLWAKKSPSFFGMNLKFEIVFVVWLVESVQILDVEKWSRTSSQDEEWESRLEEPLNPLAIKDLKWIVLSFQVFFWRKILVMNLPSLIWWSWSCLMIVMIIFHIFPNAGNLISIPQGAR